MKFVMWINYTLTQMRAHTHKQKKKKQKMKAEKHEQLRNQSLVIVFFPTLKYFTFPLISMSTSFSAFLTGLL